jgi:hypothetical protein
MSRILTSTDVSPFDVWVLLDVGSSHLRNVGRYNWSKTLKSNQKACTALQAQNKTGKCHIGLPHQVCA